MDNILPNMHERLVDHLDGISSQEDQTEVENLIASDPGWKEAWEDLLATRSAVREFGLRQKVATVHQEMMKENHSAATTGSYRHLVRPFLKVAAAVILIIAGYWSYKIYSISPEKVFRDQYNSYDISTLRSAGSSPDSIEIYFKKSEFSRVLSFFNKEKAVTNKELFLAGSAYMELKNYPKAKELFSRILSGATEARDHSFRDEAQYYMALACIATKDYDQALTLLKFIRADKDHAYHQEVTATLIRDVKLLKWK